MIDRRALLLGVASVPFAPALLPTVERPDMTATEAWLRACASVLDAPQEQWLPISSHQHACIQMLIAATSLPERQWYSLKPRTD